MNVLSLFDGMSCGQIALNKLNIKYDNYFASEIDKYAIQIAKKNYPNTKHIGDVTQVSAKDLPKIDLLIGGSPCQGFSLAGKRLAFDDPRSKLFFEFVRLLKELKPKYFLLENVKMKKEYLDIISEYLGVEPIKINSSLVSAQNRVRYYWTNIPNIEQPKEKNIVIKNILEDLPFDENPNYLKNHFGKKTRGEMVKSINDEKARCLTASMWKGQIATYIKKPIQIGVATDINGHDILKRVYSTEGKSPTLNACTGGNREPKINITENRYRKLTPIECERLQTVPDNYTDGVSKTQRYKMLGNGWTVDVITHIFQNMSLHDSNNS